MVKDLATSEEGSVNWYRNSRLGLSFSPEKHGVRREDQVEIIGTLRPSEEKLDWSEEPFERVLSHVDECRERRSKT